MPTIPRDPLREALHYLDRIRAIASSMETLANQSLPAIAESRKIVDEFRAVAWHVPQRVAHHAAPSRAAKTPA